MRKKIFKDQYTGKIIERSITTKWNKTFFYVYNGREKALIILAGNAEVPEDFTKTYLFQGVMTYSAKNHILKLHAYHIEELPDLDYKEELRKMVEAMRETEAS